MKLPSCCMNEMQIRSETMTFFEVECSACKDVIYLKKEMKKPMLIDD